ELGELVASPSARHAVETALLALWSAETQRPWWPLFCDTLRSGTTLPTGHVLDPLSARAPQELTTLLDAGVRTLKLKVGRARDAELSFVEQLAQARVPLSLRLDPNGAWTRAEAVAFLDRTCALLA